MKLTTVKVSLTTADGEVLDIFYVESRTPTTHAALSNAVRDRIEHHFSTADTVAGLRTVGDDADTDR
jgi:hypothetical protein